MAPSPRYLAMLASNEADIRAKPLAQRIAAFDALARLCNRVEPQGVSHAGRWSWGLPVPTVGTYYSGLWSPIQCLIPVA
ncbi:uncharacterized protein MYCFIDRAFT_169434 [Pseudocercospora fijiensis CIRAD86]|uniref:Uncharacterized protein n=1 Tax=Pseudocercospora fijiensis (strain CIRAD86) TaxID=383855 RepID=N1Q655_PSEFD|nr:uncharacterized protein MYCFIDRAFT_169434 [Pseudocercospora fijiensis CIRAD86]EME87649.1 hypothetical protein MYCFIDRAFT_169434 [Pseudocercospora fijiensis CIRAD86]